MVDFDAAGMLGGIIQNGRKPGIDEVKSDQIRFGLNIPGAQDRFPYKRRTIRKLCLPLATMLKAIGQTTVHYLRYFFSSF